MLESIDFNVWEQESERSPLLSSPTNQNQDIPSISNPIAHQLGDTLYGQQYENLRVSYDNYTTIDWIHDTVKDRIRLRTLRESKGVRARIKAVFDSAQAWILVLLIGVTCGTVAALIEMLQEFLADMRLGVCNSNFLLNKRLCCGFKGKSAFEVDKCQNWMSWSEIVGASGGSSSMFAIDFSMFVLVGLGFAALSTFAVCYASYFPEMPRLSQDASSSTSHVPHFATQRVFHAAGSGIPELMTILSGFVMRGFLGFRTLIFKSIGLVFSIASGLTIGKQGPLIHICCCIGNVLSRGFSKYSRNDGKRREVLSVAATAGVAAAFAAPIGGVLFSLEEISYYFPTKTMLRSFFCALVASFTIKLIDPLGNGKGVLFQVDDDSEWHFFELVAFVFVGMCGGLVGAIYIELTSLVTRTRTKHFADRPQTEVLVLTFMTAVISYMGIFTRIGNAELIALLFGECQGQDQNYGLCIAYPSDFVIISESVTWSLFLCLLVKFFFATITFGAKIPAGIFVPTMVIGALLGRIFGLFMKYLTTNYNDHPFFSSCEAGKDCIMPGMYAMVGSAAVLCGVTRMTMTGSLSHGLPIMIAVLVAKWVGDALCRDSIYDRAIYSAGYPYLDHKRTFLPSQTTAEVMISNVPTVDVKEKYSVAQLDDILSKLGKMNFADDSGVPILDDGRLVAYIAATELSHCVERVKYEELQDLPCYFKRLSPYSVTNISDHERSPMSAQISNPNDFSAFMDHAPLSVSVNVQIETVLEMFSKLGIKTLLVTRDGMFVGVIYKKKLISILRKDLGCISV